MRMMALIKWCMQMKAQVLSVYNDQIMVHLASNLNRWDVLSVTDMQIMFCYASPFESALSRWSASRVMKLNVSGTLEGVK